MKQSPDTDKQLVLSISFCKEVITRLEKDLGSMWIPDNTNGVIAAARVLLLDLGFVDYEADVFVWTQAIPSVNNVLRCTLQALKSQ